MCVRFVRFVNAKCQMNRCQKMMVLMDENGGNEMSAIDRKWGILINTKNGMIIKRARMSCLLASKQAIASKLVARNIA